MTLEVINCWNVQIQHRNWGLPAARLDDWSTLWPKIAWHWHHMSPEQPPVIWKWKKRPGLSLANLETVSLRWKTQEGYKIVVELVLKGKGEPSFPGDHKFSYWSVWATEKVEWGVSLHIWGLSRLSQSFLKQQWLTFSAPITSKQWKYISRWAGERINNNVLDEVKGSNYLRKEVVD